MGFAARNPEVEGWPPRAVPRPEGALLLIYSRVPALVPSRFARVDVHGLNADELALNPARSGAATSSARRWAR